MVRGTARWPARSSVDRSGSSRSEPARAFAARRPSRLTGGAFIIRGGLVPLGWFTARQLSRAGSQKMSRAVPNQSPPDDLLPSGQDRAHRCPRSGNPPGSQATTVRAMPRAGSHIVPERFPDSPRNGSHLGPRACQAADPGRRGPPDVPQARGIGGVGGCCLNLAKAPGRRRGLAAAARNGSDSSRDPRFRLSGNRFGHRMGTGLLHHCP